MKWRIVKSSTGYHAQYGREPDAEAAPFILNSFWATISARFDTEREAKNYIQRMKRAGYREG